MPTPKVLVITGPTASGKSALAVSAALATGAEIFSADSRQVYRGIPIITAVPTKEEMQGVRHHFIEELPLDAPFSASAFETAALPRLRDCLRRGKPAIVCGGSMLYVQALCSGLDELPDVPADIREGLMDDLEKSGIEYLIEKLRKADAVSAARIDLRNPRRVIHALEVTMTAGVPYSSLLGRAKASRGFDTVTVAIEMPRQELYERINRRVEAMRESGALEEARRMFSVRHLNSLQSVGFNELFAYFDGRWDLDTAFEKMARNTRVFAKKQIAWLKRHPADFTVSAEVTAEDIVKLWKSE